MPLEIFSAELYEKRDEVRVSKTMPANILERPCIVSFGAHQDPTHPHGAAKQAVKSACRITGISGKNGIPLYTVLCNISEKKAGQKTLSNNDPLTACEYDEDAYNFAKQYFFAGIGDALKSQNLQLLQKHFSNLTISSFSYGGMVSAETLNASRAILMEHGFSRADAKSVLAFVKHISIADPSDFGFYDSGATIYRILNNQDQVLAKYSNNHAYLKDWMKDAKVTLGKDAHFLDSAYYAGQHTVLLQRTPGSPPNNIIADMTGNFISKNAVAEFNRFFDPASHNSTTYIRHALSRHGFIGPAIIQNLHLNALNHAISNAQSQDAPAPVPSFEEMVKTPDTLLFVQDLSDKNRSLWSQTNGLVSKEDFAERVRNSFQHFHKR